ncbi:hypothetical protein ACJRO7_032232 [Eucalyptus globulus]|uniref:peroxidase n=1 Tax=Eucalyptus globulus TaxID=34317 RepID=A0ABD3JVH5_EUCGL
MIYCPRDKYLQGCDASVLLDSTNGTSAEKEAIPNRSLEEFDVINEIKDELEVECPLTVSCADILALTAQDTVSFQFGKAMWGGAHCVVFAKRLFNFTANNDTDSSLDRGNGNAAMLKAQCSSPCNTVGMDPNSSSSFDSHYFVALSQNQGLFKSDATLLTDKRAANFAWIYQIFNEEDGHHYSFN